MKNLENHLISLQQSLAKILYERSASEKKFDENDHVLIAESLMVDDILSYIQGNTFPLITRVKLEKKFSENLEKDKK